MKNIHYNEVQLELFQGLQSENCTDIQEYINKTDLKLQFRYTLTHKLAALLMQMLEKKYTNVDDLQREFDITYATLKALRNDQTEKPRYREATS